MDDRSRYFQDTGTNYVIAPHWLLAYTESSAQTTKPHRRIVHGVGWVHLKHAILVVKLPISIVSLLFFSCSSLFNPSSYILGKFAMQPVFSTCICVCFLMKPRGRMQPG